MKETLIGTSAVVPSANISFIFQTRRKDLERLEIQENPKEGFLEFLLRYSPLWLLHLQYQLL